MHGNRARNLGCRAAKMAQHGLGVDDIKIRLDITYRDLVDALSGVQDQFAVGPWLRLARQRTREETR